MALDDDVVVGFHTLVVGEMGQEQAPEQIRKGLARHPSPLMVLAGLAVAVEHQGKGLGGALLKDAIGRTLAANRVRSRASHVKANKDNHIPQADKAGRTNRRMTRRRWTRRYNKPRPRPAGAQEIQRI